MAIKIHPGGRAGTQAVKILPSRDALLIVRREETALKQMLFEVTKEPLVSPRIAVIVPVLSRPHRVAPLLASFRHATAETDAALYFVVQTTDLAEVEAIKAAGGTAIYVADIDRSWARKINRGYECTTEPWLLLGADDLSFHSGWIDRVRGFLRTYPGVIGTNDLGNKATATGSASTHPLVRRAYADVMGTADERGKITHEGYDHNFPDTELVRTAKARGVFMHRPDCVVEHMHPIWGKGQTDAVYQRGQKMYAQDELLFRKRSIALGF